MSDCLWLLRHGDTEWTESQRHTGRRDVPLSDDGRAQAAKAGWVLASQRFDLVLVSPQTRAVQTCRLALPGVHFEPCDALVEWDYGDYEGLTDEQTLQRAPGWDLFRDGCPHGESPEQVRARADGLLAELATRPGRCLLVSHGKFLRGLAARWLGRELGLGSALALDPAAISVLEREPAGPLLRLWNLTPELAQAPSGAL